MKPQTSPASFRVFKLQHGVGGGVCRKNDDDIVTPTPRTTTAEEPFHPVFTVLS